MNAGDLGSELVSHERELIFRAATTSVVRVYRALRPSPLCSIKCRCSNAVRARQNEESVRPAAPFHAVAEALVSWKQAWKHLRASASIRLILPRLLPDTRITHEPAASIVVSSKGIGPNSTASFCFSHVSCRPPSSRSATMVSAAPPSTEDPRSLSLVAWPV